jgi:NADPH-dependent curcumin reductase CurA
MSSIAKSVILIDYVEEGLVGPEHFNITESTVPELTASGGIRVELAGISPDPFLRGRIKKPVGSASTLETIRPGFPMVGFVVGKVTAVIDNSNWAVGDIFGAYLPFVTVQNLGPEDLKARLLWKLTGKLTEDRLNLGLGIYGMPGSTAYGGLIDVLRPIKGKGEVIFISAASGAVGSLVGMIAKNVYGCKVIGSCGGPEKCALITSKFGFDHAIDYKKINNKDELKAALKDVAPDGIDMYFENVGGMHFEAAYESLRVKGRIAVCGGISGYNDAVTPPVSVNIMSMIYSFNRIEGFISWPWLSGAQGNFLEDMHGFVQAGHVLPNETVFRGIESFGEAFQSLFTGKNTGKVVVMF